MDKSKSAYLLLLKL